MNWHITHCGYITDDTLHHVHYLWSTKRSKSCVGRKVCLANITNNRKIGNVVSILTMHNSFFHYLMKTNDIRYNITIHFTVSERSTEFPALEYSFVSNAKRLPSLVKPTCAYEQEQVYDK